VTVGNDLIGGRYNVHLVITSVEKSAEDSNRHHRDSGTVPVGNKPLCLSGSGNSRVTSPLWGDLDLKLSTGAGSRSYNGGDINDR